MAGDTERRELRAELEKLRLQLDHQLISFVEACSIVNSHLDETKLLYSIVDVSVMLTSCRTGHLFLLDPEDDELYLRASKGTRRQGLLRVQVPSGRGAASLVAAASDSIMSNDARSDERFQWHTEGDGEPFSRLLCVPLLSHDDRVIGAIELHDKIESDFTHKDRQFMEMLAHQAGACITSSRLFARVQEERRWISSIVDSMSDGVVVTDMMGRVALANETARQLFELNEDYEPPPGDLNLNLLMEEVASMEDAETFDFVMLKPVPNILSVRTTILKDPDQRTRAVILGMRNVKALKEIERKNLEFLSLVSHELESHFSGLESELSQKMERSASEISDLIANLVFYSEIESGPMRLERRVVDIKELLNLAATDLARIFQAREVQIKVEDSISTSILADPERIVILVKGILRFVLARARAGAVAAVRVQAADETKNEVQIVFDVEGCKLSPKEIEDLFDKTYQVENYISILGRQTTGLGFVFLEHIAEAHGGGFNVEPTGPESVRFTVTVRR